MRIPFARSPGPRGPALACASMIAFVSSLSACRDAGPESVAGGCAGCCPAGGCAGASPFTPEATCVSGAAPQGGPALAVVPGSTYGGEFTAAAPDDTFPIVFDPSGKTYVPVALQVLTDAGGPFEIEVRFDGKAGLRATFEACAPPSWSQLADVPVWLDALTGSGLHELQARVGSGAWVETPVKLR